MLVLLFGVVGATMSALQTIAMIRLHERVSRLEEKSK